MQPFFAKRFAQVEPSFIREILKVAMNPDVISFAGGLPNPTFFPHQELAQASASVLADTSNGQGKIMKNPYVTGLSASLIF